MAKGFCPLRCWHSRPGCAQHPAHGEGGCATMSCRAMIHVHELTKSYSDLRRGQFEALRAVSFHARPGEVYGLLGPNGAGKTTALRILSTVLRPTSGTATVNGFDVLLQPAAVRRQIGFMSANTARLRPDDRLGDGRVFRPAARHSEGAASPSGWSRSSAA